MKKMVDIDVVLAEIEKIKESANKGEYEYWLGANAASVAVARLKWDDDQEESCDTSSSC